MALLSLALLGGFHAEQHGQAVTTFESNKVRALLAYLVVEHGRAHQRSALAGLLWPDHPEDLARTNLRHVLRQLRQTLPDPEAGAPLLLTSQQTIQLNAQAGYTLDAARFGELLAACARCSHRDLAACPACLDRCRQAAALYQGPFLAGVELADSDLFGEWVVVQREQLHRKALDICFALAEAHDARGESEQARQYAARQIELEPWREEAHRQLMRALARLGQRSAALAQFAQCRAILAGELGVEPEAETLALYEQIRAGALARPPAEASRDRAVHQPATPQPEPEPPVAWHDWGEAPATTYFYGRQAELAQLRQWLVGDRRRLVVVLGMGGMGKTTLVAKAASTLADQFEAVFWRSLLNAPPLPELLRDLLRFFARGQLSQLPDSLGEQLAQLFGYLRRRRCLLVFDNLESILEAGQAGQYRAGYESYGQLIERAAQHEHQSCVVLTSRERPQGTKRLAEDGAPVCFLPLAGLEPQAGLALLKTRGLGASADRAAMLVEHYSGNPLALKLVARAIQELFDSDVAAFLSDEVPIFDDIRAVLDQQFARLAPLEREILLWLASEREGIGIAELQQNMVLPPPRRDLIEALRALQRRSLLEKTDTGFTLQNVVLEYVTDQLVTQCSREIERGQSELMHRHALLKAQAKQYLRQSQARLILQPIARRLLASLSQARLEQQLRAALAAQRAEHSLAPGYAAGNILNLLLHLGASLRGYDFSQLCVWQADLREASLPDVDFAGADLAGCAFTDTFGLIYTIAYSPDGQFLAVGTGDGKVHLWRVSDRQPYGVCEGHTNVVQSVAFSPDSRLLASGGYDHVVRVWEVPACQPIAELPGHADWVWSVAFSPDGQTLASGSRDQTARIWDLASLHTLHTLHGHAGWVQSVAFGLGGQLLASGGADGTIRLWDAASGRELQTLAGHSGGVASVACSPDGLLLASGGNDGSVRVWDVASGRAEHLLAAHSGEVNAVAFAPDSATLASGGSDRIVRVWDVRAGQVRHSLLGHTNRVRSVAFHPDGRTLASASADQTVRIWDTHGGQAIQTFQGHINAIWAVAFCPPASHGQHLLASASDDQSVRIWDLASGRVRHTLHGHIGDVCATAFSPDGQTLASGGVDHTVRLWSALGGRLLATLQAHTSAVWSVAFHPGVGLLASASADRSLRLWDLRTRQVVRVLQGHAETVKSVAFSPDGRLLASGSEDQTIRLWDVASGELRATLAGHTHWLRSVVFSPDGQTLASSGADQTVRLWDVATGRALRVLAGHSDIVLSVAFSPDGQTLASGSSDRSVRLWDVASGELRQVLAGHTLWVRSVAFSPDGALVASGSVDESIRLWDAAGGACLQTLRADGPYTGMNIAGVTGITDAQRAALKTLGAID